MKKLNVAFLLITLLIVISTSLVYADWTVENGHYRYQNANGNYVIDNWKKIDEINYYFNHEGNMVTGLVVIDNNVHAFNEDGSPMKGYLRIDGKSYEIVGNKGRVKDLTPGDDIEYLNEFLIGKSSGAALDQYVSNNPLISPEQMAQAEAIAQANAAEKAALDEFNKISLVSDLQNQTFKVTGEVRDFIVTMRVPQIQGANVEVVNKINQTIQSKFVEAMQYSVSLGNYVDTKSNKQISLTNVDLDTTSLNNSTIVFEWKIPVSGNGVKVVVKLFYEMATGTLYAN